MLWSEVQHTQLKALTMLVHMALQVTYNIHILAPYGALMQHHRGTQHYRGVAI